MKRVWLVIAGQSLMLPITDTDNVPASYLENQWNAWTWLGGNYGVPPLSFRRSPWRPVRRPKGPPTYPNLVGCDAAMTKQLSLLGAQGNVLQVAFGATSLATNWLPPAGPMFVQLQDEVAASLASSACLVQPTDPVLFMWDQGQTDALVFGDSIIYGANLATFTAAVRALFAPRTVYFVIFQLSTNAVNPVLSAPPLNVAAIRAAQAAFVAGDGGLSALVDDSAFPTTDGIHLTEAGSIAQGEAGATAGYALLP